MGRIHTYLVLLTADGILLLTAIAASILLEEDVAFHAFMAFGGLSLFIAILASLDDHARIHAKSTND